MEINLGKIELGGLIPGCRNFYWYEFLWLPSWGFHAYPPKDIAGNIVRKAHKMEQIRAELGGYAITINNGWRPSAYNKKINGAARSQHIFGKAADWTHGLYTPDQCRERLEPKLEEFDIRMEKFPGASWVHTDIGSIINSRYFRP